MTTFDTFRQVAQQEPEAAKIWINRVANVSRKDIDNLLAFIPRERMSQVATDFALKVLEINRDRLVELKEKLK